MRHLMGIDLGTSSVKVMIADEKGNTKGIGQVGYEVLTPAVGYAEQDPKTWWDAAVQAIGEALKKSGVAAKDIAGISFSGQMHGMVALDEEKNPVCPAIIHLDGRSLEEKKLITETAEDLMREELHNQPSTGMVICSFLWMKRNCPQEYDRIRYVMSPKDYIRFRLTGEICTDYSDASATLAFSVKKRTWCRELFARLDVKENVWPPVRESCDVAGKVTGYAAAETGLAEGTPVITGAGDCFAAMIGNGIVKPGIMTCNIGTSSQIAVVTNRPMSDKKMQCQLWCHALSDTWALQGGALNGGNTLSWLKNKVLRDERPFAEIDREVLDVPAGSDGVFFLPYLAGERTPFNNPQAKGVYFGLSMKHSQPYVVRATMEGVMYNLLECKKIFDSLQIRGNFLISSGGGAKGKAWKQIQADMLGMQVHTTRTQEEACLGAVIMAAVGAGIYGSVYEACDAVVSMDGETVDPIPANVSYYSEKLQIFDELYRSLEHMFLAYC